MYSFIIRATGASAMEAFADAQAKDAAARLAGATVPNSGIDLKTFGFMTIPDTAAQAAKRYARDPRLKVFGKAQAADLRANPTPEGIAQALLATRDPRIVPYGPCGCIEVSEREWLFFGWVDDSAEARFRLVDALETCGATEDENELLRDCAAEDIRNTDPWVTLRQACELLTQYRHANAINPVFAMAEVGRILTSWPDDSTRKH